MNANLTFPSISTLSPNGGNVAPSPPPTGGDLNTEEFAAVLTGQMFKAERQGLAAQVLGGPGLQVVSLGTKLNVITTDAPLPDLRSLATFARAQGLDETAIEALFGPTAIPKSGFTISGVGQTYTSKPAPGMAFAAALPQFGKTSFLLVDSSASTPESAAFAQGNSTAVPRMDGPPTTGELRPMKEPLDAMGASLARTTEPPNVIGASLARTKEVFGSTQVESEPTQVHALKPAAGMALAAPSPLFGKSNFEVVNSSATGLKSEVLAQGSNIAVPRMDSRTTIGELHPMKEPLAAIRSALARTKELLDPTRIEFDPTRATVDTTQVVFAPTQAVLASTQIAFTPTQAVLTPTQAVSAPTQVAFTPTQAVLAPTQVVSAPTQAVSAPTQAVSAPRDSNPKMSSALLPAFINQSKTGFHPENIILDKGSSVAAVLPPSIQFTGRPQSAVDLATQATSRPQVVNIPLATSSGAIVRATEQANTTEEQMGITLTALTSIGPTGAKKVAQASPDMRLNASADESIQDAIRLSITMPAKDITKRPPNTAGTTETINWSAMLNAPGANKVGLSVMAETLYLTVPEGFDLEEQSIALTNRDQDPVTASGTPQPSEGSAAKSAAASANPLRGEPSTSATQTELRAVQQQQLADRLGEAAAHRLIAQIERGEWKMQMRLQPGKLGKIDVELTMNARGLEAMFSADSALTRELIAQGSARLKDTLAQAGMTVASVIVNGDQARQSGGNSTPQHGHQATAYPQTIKARTEAHGEGPETLPTGTIDRLNILA